MKITGKLLQQGPLRYYAAKDITVLAVTPLGKFKLFKIIFGPDGSIYVPFPYLETNRGLLSEVDPSVEPDPRTLNLRRTGVLVEEDVKFAHHTTGVVHFSKTKGTKDEALVLPGRISFALDGEGGRVFDLRFYWKEGMKKFDERKAKRTLPFAINFPEHPAGLRVWALWRKKTWVLGNRDDPSTVVGPQHVATSRSTGHSEPFIFFGHPVGHELQDYLLLLSYSTEPPAAGTDMPTMLFWGGHDPHDTGPPATTKMLAFMYPYDGPAP